MLHADKVGYGAGAYGYGAPDLYELRKRIVDPKDRAEFLSAIAMADTAGCTFAKPDLVNVPKGFIADGDWEHLLRRKSFVVRTIVDQEMPDWIRTDQATPEIMKLANAVSPFLAWLAKS